ncbi:MAG: orotidine-5'-phosphate decarboxylase [Proteobacteria bacterium]|nr:orotidine-5'-phosphate decarboxylase [Pseudomonadota bacterium]
MSAARFSNPIFAALDTPDLPRALEIAKSIRPHVGGLKVGLEFITALGPDAVRQIVATGSPIFADTKFHDIPNTVAGASKAIAALGISIFNIHASGGEAMMRAAKDAAASVNPNVKLIAVTVLTSLEDSDLDAVGQKKPARDQVLRLAELTKKSGLDGVVCSAHEIEPIRKAIGPDFMLVVPGIRPAGADLADQKRVMTPSDALKKGADILVIGRPIVAAKDPAVAAKIIADEIAVVA